VAFLPREGNRPPKLPFSPYCLNVLKAICHSAESGWVTVSDLDRVSDLRAEKGNVLWAEAPVAHLTEEDVALIAEEFGLHPLAVEDAVHTRQRPKFEEYENHLFLVMHQLDELNDQLEATQIACFVGPRYVLLLHAGADRTLQEAKRRWKDDEARVTHAADLVHTLVDVVVDDYQVHADRLENETEEIEEIVLNQPHARIDHQLYSLKQQLARLRRYVTPAGRLLDSVLSPNTEKGLSPETAALFNDVHDHLLRIADEIRNVDDLVQAVLDLSRGEQSRALNEVTKQLSGWAAIFAVATLIAGVYGMNFTLIPWGGQVEGFWFAIVLMGLLAVTLYLFFKKRNWL
jgi:magnesium transporter